VENNEKVSNPKEKGQNEPLSNDFLSKIWENFKKVENDEKGSNNQEKGQDGCKN
jgi:hypothetical protein